MEDAICDYGVDFHQMLMEESIKYMFDSLTNQSKEKINFKSFILKWYIIMILLE